MDEFDQDKPSKSARKRAHKALQQQVEQLCRLGEEKLRALELPERITEELQLTRSMKPSSARNRQIRFITTLLEDLDEEQLASIEARISCR